MKRHLWAVVTVRDGVPLLVDGPYLSRADARDVKRRNEEEERAEPMGDAYRVVPMWRLSTTKEIARWVASHEAVA